MSRKGVKAESWALVRGVGEGVHHEWGLERGELFFDGSTVGEGRGESWDLVQGIEKGVR